MKISVLFVAGALTAMSSEIAAQTVTDAQIASIVVTANQVDIDAGKLAASKATSPEVKAFGQQMVTDHSGVNKSATELVTKLNVKPEDNPTSQSIASGGEQNVANLKTLKGAAFDKAYIDQEVTIHKAVLDLADKANGDTENAELKALIEKAKPTIQKHLDKAEELQEKLGKVTT